MKVLLSLFAAFLMSVSSNAQQKDYLWFPIEKASINSVDCSEHYKRVRGFISFYQSKIGNFCMANVMPAKDTQSYGEISERSKKSIQDVLTGSTIYILDFIWNYENNYDDRSGVAKCHLNFSPSKIGYDYSLEMIVDNGSILHYSGSTNDSISSLLENW